MMRSWLLVSRPAAPTTRSFRSYYVTKHDAEHRGVAEAIQQGASMFWLYAPPATEGQPRNLIRHWSGR